MPTYICISKTSLCLLLCNRVILSAVDLSLSQNQNLSSQRNRISVVAYLADDGELCSSNSPQHNGNW